jgi:hypothetical protein
MGVGTEWPTKHLHAAHTTAPDAIPSADSLVVWLETFVSWYNNAKTKEQIEAFLRSASPCYHGSKHGCS